MHVFICKSCALFHIYYTFIGCLLLFSITLFVSHFIPFYEVFEGLVCLYLCQFFCQFLCPIVIRYTLCFSIIRVLVGPLQILWGYIIALLVLWCVSLSVCLFSCIFERYVFHIITVLCHWCLIVGGPGGLYVKLVKGGMVCWRIQDSKFKV